MRQNAMRREEPDYASGKERFFDKDTFIVSKTDLKGIIKYANNTFLEVADYTEDEVIGKPHNIIRHPDMPKCVFKLLWERIKSGQEIFAYVVNSTKYGDYYWVLAHVTPSFNERGEVVGYHSNRRVPERDALSVIQPIYKQLVSIEQSHSNPKEGMEASYQKLHSIIHEKGISYDQFIFSL